MYSSIYGVDKDEVPNKGVFEVTLRAVAGFPLIESLMFTYGAFES